MSLDLNNIVRNVANTNITKGFDEFMKNLSNYPRNIEVTIANVVGATLWNELTVGEKISLGKVVKDNIICGNLEGIVPIDTPPGKNNIYKIIGKIKMLTIFTSEYLGEVDSIESVLKKNRNSTNYAFIKCHYSKNSNNNIFLETEALDSNGNIIYKSIPKIIDNSYYINNYIDEGNFEFNSILSLWYGYDRAYENKELLNSKGINSICFFAPNSQMMLRVAGEKFDTPNNIYNYTTYIQNAFYLFKKNQLKELPFNHSIISLKNKYIN